MTLEVPQHYAQVVHSLELSGDPDPYAITYGVEIIPTPTVTSPTDFAALLDGYLETRCKGAWPTTLTLRQTEVRWQADPSPADPVIGVYSSNTAGTNVGATSLLPPNNAVLIHKRTALAGRKGRGRMYWPAVPESWANNLGVMDSTVLADFQSRWNNVLSDIIAHSDFVGMALFHDDENLTANPGPTLVSSLVVDSVLATQRRRLRK